MHESTEYACGAHRIVRCLGMGHTSEVLLAVASGPFGFERAIVVKRLLARCERETELQRIFIAEALAHARLSHPAIVQLYDFVSTDGRLELILEYVDGVSLARARTMLRVAGEPLGDPSALYIASRIFAALAAAHAAHDPRTGAPAPVIHRDVSPGNVLVPWDGFVKLGDFGMAKVTGFASDTRVGMLKGTYGYMAPEQVLGDSVTPRTDVYGACLVLRELLLSRATFVRGDTPELEFLRVMSEPRLAPIEELRGGLSPRLIDALHRGLAPDPACRTLTAEEMIHVLRAETELERGREILVAKLSRVRPSGGTGEQRSVTPPLGIRAVSQNDLDILPTVPEPRELETRPRAIFDTPMSLTREANDAHDPADMPDVTPEPGELPVLPHPPQRALRRAWPAALAAAACIGLFTMLRASPGPSASATGEARAPTRVRVHDPVVQVVACDRWTPTPTLIEDAPDASGATTGDVITPASARAHRVFVDGREAAARSGVTLHVACGSHVIRIGSHGRDQAIDVPCGGEARIDARSR